MNIRFIYLYLFLSTLCTFIPLRAQTIIRPTGIEHDNNSTHKKEDKVPEGISTWHIDPRFGTIRPVVTDTLPHLFPNENYTDGLYGNYNYLGNLGSPRISRLFTQNDFTTFTGRQFVFERPYDYFLRQPEQLYFTNTKSPFTNLTYHECGNKHNGEDHFRSRFAVNINKRLGLGFNFDYVYGRGYYNAQSTSQFNALLYASYISDNYDLHSYYSSSYLKTRENGGIESDDYILRPQIFPSSYNSNDIPTRLEHTFNKLHINTFYLTHRYNFGFTRYTDTDGKIIKLSDIKKNKALNAISTGFDSLSIAQTDSIATDSTSLQNLKANFIPVAGIIHTLRIDQNRRLFLSNDTKERSNGYFYDHYLPFDSAHDAMHYLHLGNLLALEVSEGFNRWVKSGMRLYTSYDYYRYTLPGEPKDPNMHSWKHCPEDIYHDHYFSLGGQLYKHRGRYFRYNVLGEMRSNGKNWGEFNVEGKTRFLIPLGKDSIILRAESYLRNEQPNFYYRHFHGRNAKWDNELDNELTFNIHAALKYKNTHLSLDWRNIHHYTHLMETPFYETAAQKMPLYGIDVVQKKALLHLFSATFKQDIRFGIFNWENALTLQTTSDADDYPLPLVNLWSNIYLKFRIAKVLGVEMGSDIRIFSPYYAPTYSPITGLYATQGLSPEGENDLPAGDNRIKLGKYPIINAYVNFCLKRTRFYVACSHLNASKGHGNPFLVPHHPINPLLIRLGISWNFIN